VAAARRRIHFVIGNSLHEYAEVDACFRP